MDNQLQHLTGLIELPWLDLIPTWLQALFIAGLSLILAWIIERFVVAATARMVRSTKTNIDDQLVESLRRPLFLSIFFVGLVTATQLLALPDTLTRITLASLGTIATIVWLGFLIRLASLALGIVSKLRGSYEFVQPSTLPLFDNTAKIILFLGAIYFIFLAWGIDVSALVASAGIVGLALSFAARDALSNIFGGMSILADRPYLVGDYINLDSGERGQVTHIGLRSTRMLTRDDVEISVPNSVMGNAKIINESGGPYEKFRIRMKVSVAYGSDVDQVEAVLIESAEQHPEVCEKPEPRVRFRAFGSSSIDFELLAWVEQPVHKGRLEHELNCGIYKAFTREKIKIPFPQQDVHIKTKQGE